jgi:quinol-cytochrome oxidoreductase complex cytochrome b subunit
MQIRLNNNFLLSFLSKHLIDYPTPTNLSIFWSFGSLSGICLVLQIATGIFLAMHYTPHIEFAFYSVEHIMRDVPSGWILRYMHANGASFFFLVVYIHIFRGLYFGSYMYPRQSLWISGIFLFLSMMATAFMGYVLPWGQMSFWGATVITNLFSAVPIFGFMIVEWLWGGFSVDNATLNRFFSLHYFLPFIIAGLSILHLSLLHHVGSNNPLGVNQRIKITSFFPYFYIKDLFYLFIFLIVYLLFVFFIPNELGHPDNYITANPMVTPAHIVPEWYFLPFYAILRSIPDKLGGVLAMFGSIVILMALPLLTTSKIRSTKFRPIFKFFYWSIFGTFLILGWIGQQPVETPYIEVGIYATLYYFIFFLFLVPCIGVLEDYVNRMKAPLPPRLSGKAW